MNLATMHSETVLRVDELFDPTSGTVRQDDEVRADMFAGMLLMPRVCGGPRVFGEETASRYRESPRFLPCCVLARRWDTRRSPGTFITRFVRSPKNGLPLWTDPRRKRSANPSSANPTSEELVIVDEQWSGRPVDAAVGDLLLLPPGTATGGTMRCAKRAVLAHRGAVPSRHNLALAASSRRAVGLHS
jgi:hypothetical protein